MLLAVAAAGGGARAAELDESSLAVRQVVLDILSFSRWPGTRTRLSLCVVGQASYAGALFDRDGQSGGTPVRPQRMSTGDEHLGDACDAVYEGRLTTSERESVARRIAGHPVLSVSEPAAGCIESAMFCLRVEGIQVSFSTNLDAISRSGVRLDPRVLLLGRRRAPGAG